MVTLSVRESAAVGAAAAAAVLHLASKTFENFRPWRCLTTLRYNDKCNSVLWHDLTQRECVGRTTRCARQSCDKGNTCAGVQECQVYVQPDTLLQLGPASCPSCLRPLSLQQKPCLSSRSISSPYAHQSLGACDGCLQRMLSSAPISSQRMVGDQLPFLLEPDHRNRRIASCCPSRRKVFPVVVP